MWSAVMDVGEWLKGIGLGQYEATFRAHDIDVDVLPDVTEADLEKIGLPLGARKRLMKAIANLRPPESRSPPEPLWTTPEPSRPPAAPLPPPRARPEAERRPITVMFCDLVGSTSLAAKLDAEDWRNIVNAYLDEASAAVTGLGGHVLKRLGDGLMALFGYPQAQENDAERAVRAALAIQRALADINARNAAKGAPELSARIGIEFGPVVVEATGELFGDAPNLAARVQAEAEPDSVLITLNVQRQVAGLFVAEEQGARVLKGVSEPAQLFRIVRASGGGRRGGARTLTPFVGREEELGLLARRWERASVGEGQLVLVVGEPGLGKSRLIEEFHARLAETPHTWVEWSASQLLQNTPLHPIAEWGRLRFGMDAPAEQRFADLEGTLRSIGLDPVEHAPVLAPLVDIPLPAGRAANLSPEELRRRQLAAMTAWVLAGARSQPAVVAFEDLHWADPTSLDLLRALAERGAHAPLLLLATTRPEFRAPWSLRSHHGVISLSPLDRAGVARMVGEISARHALSKDLVDEVSKRTGGVPLFVEEVTRLLVERGEQGGVQAIPLTLQQSLAARLDRLGPAREVAQIGAVLGRDFAYPLLRDVAEIDGPALQASLDRLADADLLFVEGAPPQATYRFKHALIQDAAYDSLLKSRRQALHRRAAELLREEPERAAAEPEVIAHHFTEACLDDLAIEWWGKAGDQALRRSAFQEAIAHLGKAIEMADKAGGDSRKQAANHAKAQSDRSKLHSGYALATMMTKGFNAEETRTALARAESQADQAGMPHYWTVLYGRISADMMGGDHRSARAGAEAFVAEAEAAGLSGHAAVARRLLGFVKLSAGEPAGARADLTRALADYDDSSDESLRAMFGSDHRSSALVQLAVVNRMLGDLPAYGRCIDEGLRYAKASGQPNSYATALFHRMVTSARPETILSVAEELRALAAEHDLKFFRVMATNWMEWARVRLGEPRADAYRAGAAALAETGARWAEPMYYAGLADIERIVGRLDAALAAIDRGLALSAEIGQHFVEPLFHRLRGEALRESAPEQAAAAYRESIEMARLQGARTHELLSALPLAKLYQSTGLAVEGRAVLAPALEGFTPTDEMPEIAEAQALLAALAKTDEGGGATSTAAAIAGGLRQRAHRDSRLRGTRDD